MAFKKIIHNAFEQVVESGRDMAKSSVKQVQETLSPWEMIQNSFDNKGTSAENQPVDGQAKLKETQGKGKKHTPLDLNKLEKSYANQDQKNIEVMKQRLFQLVKKDEEKTLVKGKQEKAEKERSISQEEAEKRRREEKKRRQQTTAAAPQGKSGRGSAFSKKKRKPTEPQPAETKPGSGKQ